MCIDDWLSTGSGVSGNVQGRRSVVVDVEELVMECRWGSCVSASEVDKGGVLEGVKLAGPGYGGNV